MGTSNKEKLRFNSDGIVYQVDKRAIMVFGFFVVVADLTLASIIWKVDISVEEMSPSNWRISNFVGEFLD